MALRRINPRSNPSVLVSRAAFSSSSDPPSPPPPPPPPTNDPDATRSPSPPPPDPAARPSTRSPLFGDIRERLKSSSTPSPTRRIPLNPPRPNPGGGQDTLHSLESIRAALKSLQPPRPVGGAPPAPGRGVVPPSFQSLIKNADAQRSGSETSALDFDSLRNSLNVTAQKRPQYLPPDSKIFNREKSQRDGKSELAREDKGSGMALARSYTYEELGQRLGGLRPANVAKDGKDWFSLQELQGRIAKLAKLEEEEAKNGVGHLTTFMNFRESLSSLRNLKASASAQQTVPMSFLGNITGQGMMDYTRHPPQEELLQRYFHPDHMSAEEKMKLELHKVRDEFKMSENDCGSARVQIAQLTVKIKYLSSVLHKKDKHSRKGLLDMVQRRKKYLKYLRRTDWDSYCLVLSNLGLRDVPEYKAPDYKSKSTSKAKSKKSKSKSKRKMKA